MKKFMKVCAIIVAVILVIGLLLLTVGGLGGGMKQLGGQILNGDFSFGPDDFHFKWDDKWIWNEDWETYDLSEKDVFSSDYEVVKDRDSWEQDFIADGVTSLNLELGGCKVAVTTSPDEEFHVLASKISAFQAFVKNGTLHVRGLQTGNWNFTANTTMEVIIQIPSEIIFTEVNLSLGAGDFTVDSLTAQKVTMEVGAGRLQVDEMVAGELECQIGAGQVVLENAEVESDAGLEVGVGEIRMEGNVDGDLLAECAMGNIEIIISGSTEKDHNYVLECAAGNLTAGSHTIAGLASEQEIDNDALSTYELTCAMGNLSLTFR